MNRYVALVPALVLCLAARANEPRPNPAQLEFFEAKVRPVLAAHCLSCHGPEKQKSGLRLDSRSAILAGGETGPVFNAVDPESSALIEVVNYSGDVQMPPKGKLKDEQVQALRQWVKMGAPWPESIKPTASPASAPRVDPRSHWAFQKVRNPVVPAVKASGWPKSPIDHFVLAALEAKGLTPVEPAEKRVLLRRVSFDLTGLPPNPEEVAAFLADGSSDAFGRVVDRLLASPRYGERWGRHWLDVARYGEDQAHTFEARLYPQGYRYRDWVVKALNDDMPYDEFVIQQIAGDQLDGPGREGRLAALGFFALGPVYYGNAVADERDDRIDTLSRGFLALTVSCARCHDHKFDPIPTHDYYALAGVFGSTEYKEYPAAPKDVIDAFDNAQAAIKQKTADVETFVALASLRPFFSVPTVPKKDAEKLLSAASKPRLKALKAELEQLKKSAPARYPVIHGLADASTVKNMRIAIRGNAQDLGAEAPRAFLSVLCEGTPAPFKSGSGRLDLARAIASPDNPLTARVIVNRVWEHHFGRGIVATPSNFGTLGEAPSHPELLDYLTSRFVAEGWSLKRLHRAILLTSTYQLSSRREAHNEEVDADNTLLWRMNRRRLEVEAWRDAMLAVSGALDTTLGGPSRDLASSDNRRRTLYGAVSRHNLDPLLRLFDFPDPNLTADRRAVTSVPLQQLFVLNSEFMIRQAKSLAGRLNAMADNEPARLDRAYVLLYGRTITDEELSWASQFLHVAHKQNSLSAWEQYAQVLLGANEFAFVD